MNERAKLIDAHGVPRADLCFAKNPLSSDVPGAEEVSEANDIALGPFKILNGSGSLSRDTPGELSDELVDGDAT